MDALLPGTAPHGLVPTETIAIRFLLALVCGSILGFEREWRHHAAGLRTHILVSLSAAVLAILAIEIIHSGMFAESSTRIDPMRLIEATTNGVAFLAAGTIAFTRGRVIGLTTGAGMWIAGAIGLACGLGFWRVALMATAAAVTVLWFLRYLEGRFMDGNDK